MSDDDMPCGNCPAGTYDVIAVLRGLAMFGACKSKQEAIDAAPKCKRDPGRTCRGCVHWIMGTRFPVSDDELRKIGRVCFEPAIPAPLRVLKRSKPAP